MCFDPADGYEIEENFAGARLVENAIENSSGARVEEFGLDERIFLGESIEQPLDVFNTGRRIPDQRGFLLCSLDEFAGVTVLGSGACRKPNGKEKDRRDQKQEGLPIEAVHHVLLQDEATVTSVVH